MGRAGGGGGGYWPANFKVKSHINFTGKAHMVRKLNIKIKELGGETSADFVN